MKVYIDLSMVDHLEDMYHDFPFNELFKLRHKIFERVLLDTSFSQLKDRITEEDERIIRIFLSYYAPTSWNRIQCYYCRGKQFSRRDYIMFVENTFLFIYFLETKNFIIFSHFILAQPTDIIFLMLHIEREVDDLLEQGIELPKIIYYFVDKYNFSILDREPILQLGTQAILSFLPTELINTLKIRRCSVCHNLFQATEEHEYICSKCSMVFDKDPVVMSITKENEVVWH